MTRTVYIDQEQQALCCRVCADYQEIDRAVFQNAELTAIQQSEFQQKHKSCAEGRYRPPAADVRVWTPPKPEQTWALFMKTEVPPAGSPATSEMGQ